MKKWILQSDKKFEKGTFKEGELLQVLLENRGIKSKQEIEEFLSPSLDLLNSENLGLDNQELNKSLDRVKKAIDTKEQVIVFGDYDVDGVTGSAILWETLNALGANVMPYIPHRIEEGYGLSKKGIDNLKEHYPSVSLIITVDNGIVASDAVDYANENNIEVIVTDHHTVSEIRPKAFSIIHSTKICGAGVAWFFSRFLEEKLTGKKDLKRADDN
jgi:single-stranded-DNA-specific exonuclease